MRHILSLKPDLIKLDISLIRNINEDTDKRALATALVSFGRQTHADVVAEGVENAAELLILRSLGVTCAQGYLLARPMPLANAEQRAAVQPLDPLAATVCPTSRTVSS